MTKPQPKSITVGQVADVLDAIAPPALAQSWDNVGLLVGDASATCRRILLCIDLTPPVLAEAIAGNCQMVLAYHPPMFRPVNRLLAQSQDTDAVIHNAIAKGIAIYSPHTALDAAPGGTNDILAGLCKLADVQPFEYVTSPKAESKIVTFVPAQQADRLASAMSAAGAGQIGQYSQCSYRLQGEGTFFGREGTNPTIGQPGQLERVPEIRIEMVAPNSRLPEIVTALRNNHPYEEPAFDIYPLTSEPTQGIGRVGTLPANTTLGKLAQSLQQALKARTVATVGNSKTRIRRAAVCVGAAGRLPIENPRSARCDVIVTGEIRHHDALAILRASKTAIALGHWESERPVLAPLAKRLKQAVRQVTTMISKRDKSPFNHG